MLMSESPHVPDQSYYDYTIQPQEGSSKVAKITLNDDNTISAEELLRLRNLIKDKEEVTRMKIGELQFVLDPSEDPARSDHWILTIVGTAGNNSLDCDITPETAGGISLIFPGNEVYKEIDGVRTLLYPLQNQRIALKLDDLPNLEG